MDRLPPLPTPPSPPSRAPFPVIAVIAPLLGAIVIGAVTGSVFVLVFAVLSPIIAIATTLDSRRTARRHRREEAARFDRECRAWAARIPAAHAAERVAADALNPPLARLLLAGAPSSESGSGVRIGTAPGDSRIAPDAPFALPEGADGERIATLLDAARRHPALPVAVQAGRVRVIGGGAAADALARLVELHPSIVLERSESAPASGGGGDPRAVTTEIAVESATRARVRLPDGRVLIVRPEGATRRQAALAQARWRTTAPEPPTGVRWSALAEAAPGSTALAIGAEAEGAALIDLVAEGPHAIVGGTTGSGKSEFLRTAALAWAAGGAPRERSILLVDFKGGATFGELESLPHVVGLITDLDAPTAERALRSLRAEIRRRESVLHDHGLRDVRELPSGVVARLLVLVDEYAALVETFPELQPLFADLSARGRSLGIHLVLCTQHPDGVVRDAVAANCPVRIAFRTAAVRDAAGLLGGAPPPPEGAPPGRAVIAEGGRVRTVQIATITDDDVARVATRWGGAPAADRPWVAPLPSVIARESLISLPPEGDAPAPTRETLAIGALDEPERQRRAAALWRPLRDGPLLVVGVEGSGATTALATLAAAASERGTPVVVVPDDVPDALGVLDELHGVLASGAFTETGGPLLIIDALDGLLAEAGDASLELLELLDAIARRLRRVGGGLAASVRSVLAARSGVSSRFDSVLLLRAPTPDDHRAAGGPAAAFDRDAPPGRGWWRGRALQVALPASGLPEARRPDVPEWNPVPGQSVGVLSSRPRALARRLQQQGVAVALEPRVLEQVRLAAPAGEHLGAGASRGSETPTIVIADSESWQSSWTALGVLRQEGAIVVADAAPAEARAVLGHRASLPMRGAAPEEIILIEEGEPPRRAVWSVLAER